jgi:poly(A) polymerase
MKKEIYYKIREKLKEYLKDSPYLDKTYCVGGCVRDLLLEKEIKDIDLVVELPRGGIDLAKYLEELGVLLYPPVVYQNFGTTQFRLSDFPEHELEAVQTRSEKYISRESRNPVVGYGDLDKDWRRRDFTVNSMYQPIGGDKILDPSGKGLEDLRNKIIRTTSDPQVIFDDDPLRVLRCIRFSAKLGWEIEPGTWKGVCDYSGRLEIISQERITSEIEKILTSDNPSYGLDLLYKSGALRVISGELYQTTKMTQNKYHIGTVWEHTLEVVRRCKHKDLIVLWSAFLHDIGKLKTKIIDSSGAVHFIDHAEVGSEMCDGILRGFKLPIVNIGLIKTLVARHMDFKSYSPDLHDLKDKKIRKLQYQLGEEQYWRLLDLIEADNMSHAPGYCIEGQMEILKERTLKMKTMFNYSLPISGVDIMEVRKIEPGKLVKGYLDYCMKLAFVNPDITREELLRRLKNLSSKHLGKEWEAYI